MVRHSQDSHREPHDDVADAFHDDDDDGGGGAFDVGALCPVQGPSSLLHPKRSKSCTLLVSLLDCASIKLLDSSN